MEGEGERERKEEEKDRKEKECKEKEREEKDREDRREQEKRKHDKHYDRRHRDDEDYRRGERSDREGDPIALLIATMIKVGASLAQKAKVGQRCPIASIRVSPINLFSLTTFTYNPLRILTINVHGLGTTCKRDLFLHELNEN